MDVEEAARMLLDMHLASRENKHEAREVEVIFTTIVEDALVKTSLLKPEQIQELFSQSQDMSKMKLHIYKNMTREQLWLDCAEKMSKMTQGIIEFAKLTPGFMKLSQDDQIRLLQSKAFDLIILRVSRYMDLSTGQVLVAEENALLPEDAFYTKDTKEMKLITLVFTLAKSIAELKLTETQLGLYSALVLFSSGCPRLRSVADVRMIYELTLRALKTQLSMIAVDELVAKIPLLKEASRMHIDVLNRFKRSHDLIEFPALHKELFKLDS